MIIDKRLLFLILGLTLVGLILIMWGAISLNEIAGILNHGGETYDY